MNFRSILILLMIVCCGCGKSEKKPVVTPAGPSAGGSTLHESLTQAIDAAETILKISPTDKDALLAAAIATEHLGHGVRAIQYYTRLHELTQETEYLGKLAELQEVSDPASAVGHAARFFEQGGQNDRLRLWLIKHRTQKNELLAAYRLTENLSPPPDQLSREFLRDLCLRVSQSRPAALSDGLEAIRRSANFAPLPANLVETAALTFLRAGDAEGARDLLKGHPSPSYLLRAKIADLLGDAQDALTQRLKYFYSGGRDPQELLILMESLGRASSGKQVAEHLWSQKTRATLDARSRLSVANRLAEHYRQAADTAAEIQFLEEAKDLGEPSFLDRLADLQRAMGNAREALAALRSRYPKDIPENKMDVYVNQALSAGETEEAFRVAAGAPLTALAPNTRRRLAEILNALAQSDLAAGQISLAKNTALRAGRFWADLHGHKIMARIALAESDTPSALSHLFSALKMSSGDPHSNYLTGKILYTQGRYSEAKPHLQSAYAGRHPEDDLSFMLGRIHYMDNTPSMAYALLSEYARAKADQVSSDVQELLARSAMAHGRGVDAAMWFERRLMVGDDEKLAAEYLDALILAGQKSKALGVVRSYTIKYPTSKPILAAAVYVFDASADSPALLRTLESLSSIETDPAKKFPVQRRLVDIKLRMGRVAEADALLSVLLERNPDDAQLLTMAWNLRKGTPAAQPILKRLADIRSVTDPIQLIRARQIMEMRDLSGALSVVKAYLASKHVAADPDALSLQGEILAQMGNAAEAAATYRALLKIRPDDAARHWLIRNAHDQALAALAAGAPLANGEALYAEASSLLGSEEKYLDLHEVFGKQFSRDVRLRPLAIDAFQRELKLTKDPKKRAHLSESLGRWYLEEGQLSLARDMFAVSQKDGNTHAQFLRVYAALLGRLGDSAGASDLYKLLLKQSPYDREANLYLARRAADEGRPEEAIRSLEALRAASPDDSGVLDALGRAYEATRQKPKATSIWGKLAIQTGSLGYTAKYADALYESGNYQEALLEYRRLMTSGVADPSHLRRLAELEQSQGNWKAAEEIVMRLLRLGGGSGGDRDRSSLAEVLRRLGDRAIQQGNASEASRTAERLLAINANDPTAFLLMGRAKLLEGKPAAAAESFSQARSLSSNDPKAILGLAEAELRQQRPVAALDYARQALMIDTTLPDAYSLIGLAFQRQGDVRRAYEALKLSIHYSKNRALAHVRMGDLFLNHGKYNVALEQYRQALAIDPKSALARRRNAMALYKLGFLENAMKELLTAMDLDPEGGGTEAAVLLSEMLVNHGNVEAARQLLESASDKPGAPPEVLFRLGEIARRSGEYQKSVRFFKDALAARGAGGEPSFRYDILNALGLSLSALNEKGAAEKTLKDAMGLQPNRPDALLNLSLLYRSQKNFVAAVDHARKAVVASPRSPEGYKLLGLIYYEAGWEKESLGAFRESLRLNPDQPEVVNLVRGIDVEEEE